MYTVLYHDVRLSRVLFSEILCHAALFILLTTSPTISLVSSSVDNFNLEFSVLEEQHPSTFVGAIHSFSSKANPPFKVYFANGNDSLDLDVTRNGLIIAKRSLNREFKSSYEILAESSQGSYVRVVVTVTDVNDNSPIFDPANVCVHLPETFPVDVPFFVNDAVDADVENNGVQRYNVVEGNDMHLFQLRSFRTSRGLLMFEMSLSGSLDFEKTQSYDLVVRAYDGGVPSQFGDLIVNLTVDDVNDNPPIFSQTHFSVSIPQSTPNGTSVLQVHATDADFGRNGEVDFGIKSLDDVGTTETFSVDRTTGIISVDGVIDYSVQNHYLFSVVARDNGSPSLKSAAIVDVQILEVRRNLPVLVVRFQIEDGSNKLNDLFRLNEIFVEVTVVGFDAEANSNPFHRSTDVVLRDPLGYFALEKLSHDRYFLTLAKRVAFSARRRLYRMSLTAYCSSNEKNSTVFKNVTVLFESEAANDKSFTLTRQIYRAEIPASAAAGFPVLRVMVSGGGSSKVTFKMDSTTNRLEFFQINDRTGMISTSRSLGCATMKNVMLTVRGFHPNGLTVTADVLINVTVVKGHAPSFDQPYYQIFVDEDRPVGTCIKKMSVHDPDCDTNRKIFYFLSPSSDSNSFFMKNQSGELCVGKDLDYSKKRTHHFTVSASSGEGFVVETLVQILVVDVNNHHPVFTSYFHSISLHPSYPSDNEVAIVQATDKDAGIFGKITYRIEDGDEDGRFFIDPQTGVIRLNGSPLDAKDRYNLSVIAVDGGELISKSPITVLLRKSRNHLPLPFTRSLFFFNISKDAPSGHTVGAVGVQRKNFPDLKYTFVRSAPSHDAFTINEETGVISTVNQIDQELTTFVILTVKATYLQEEIFAQVAIRILDADDVNPCFDVGHIHLTLREDVAVGTLVYSATAKYKDSFVTGKEIFYRLTGSGSDDFFSVDKLSGELRLHRSLNYEVAKAHSFEIVAFGAGNPSRSAYLDISVTVVNVNDDSPVFTSSNYTFAVDEGIPVGSYVGTVNAIVVLGSGVNGRVFYHLSTYADVFSVDPLTGSILSKIVLDYEAQNEFLLVVTAFDDAAPARTSDSSVVVVVRDVDEFDPEFAEDSYAFFAQENHRLPSTLGYVTAVDLDGASRLTYSLVPSSSLSSPFAIASDSGKIVTTKALDREEKNVHVLTVCAVDVGSSRRNATTVVTIHVKDVNDNSPRFTPRSAEPVHIGGGGNLQIGAFVTRVLALDPDSGENGTVTYHLESHGRNSPIFAVDINSGVVSVKALPSKDAKSEYVVKVIARDGGIPYPRSAAISLKIRIENAANKISTDFSRSSLSFVVEEDCPVGTTVGIVVTTTQDIDAKDGRQLFIVQGNQYGTFGVNSSTGRLFVDRSIDYESTSSFSLLIRSTTANVGESNTFYNVSVNVIDLNDNQPYFRRDHVIVRVVENVPNGTFVYQVEAFDDDAGNNALLTYAVSSQTPSRRDWFFVDGTSGRLFTNTVIDREEIDLISVFVTAIDGAADSEKRFAATIEISVVVQDVNDNEPVFNMSVTDLWVAENDPERTPLLEIVASDADGNENGRISYGIAYGNSDGHFQIDSETGVLFVAQTLDRESMDEYHLVITAEDHGIQSRLSAKYSLTIHVTDVNDNVPTFNQTLYNATVLEGEPEGTIILTLSATDLDDPTTSNTDLFFFIPGDLSDSKFVVDSLTGRLRTAEPLDREERDRWVLTVHVSNVDRLELYDSTTVVVYVADVNDNRPVFHDSVYSLEISENTNMAVVHTIEATDEDVGDNGKISYSINDDMAGKFSIHPQTGRLSCLALDREATPSYNLTIVARDNGRPVALTGAMMIIVRVLDDNDNDPIFDRDSYLVSIPEDVPENSSILKLEASDLDDGTNAVISYSLSNGASGLFVVDGVTGVITTAGEFDREKTSAYSFEAIATDGGLYGPRSRTVRVDITILDVNDNTPVFDRFPYRADIPLDFPVGQTVLTVSATDKDAGRNGQILYSLVEHSQYFQVDPSSGQITTRRLLDIGSVKVHTLKVRAQDKADWPKNSTGVVSIQVGNAKTTGVLRFLNQTYSIYIPENCHSSTAILSVQARFASGSNQQLGPSIIYSFANGNEDSTFSIDSNSGRITVTDSSKLDYEASPRLRLIVIATAGTAYDYTTIWINLKDVNDNAPRFSQQRYASSVWEGNVRGTYVTQVVATDVDAGLNGRVTYAIVNGNERNAFIVDPPNTGIVKTNVVLDREVCASYRLEIEAIDSGKPPLSSVVTLRIQVIDVNDNAPVFDDMRPILIREGIQVGTMIFQATASDADLNPTLMYGFYGNGNLDDTFSIDRYSGKILVAKKLDYENCASYRLIVVASDEVHNSTGNLIVNVIDENDNSPLFDQSLYQAVIPELTGPNVYVMTVRGNDADSGDNGRIDYSMLPSDGFFIDNATGAIYTNNVVIFNKQQPFIHLVVTARDRGTPPLSSVLPIRLEVIDINNHAPRFQFNAYSVAVKEDLAVATNILQTVAIDDDHLPENTRLRYSIVDGNEDLTFGVNENTGNVRLDRTLDRETTSNYSLVVSARDNGQPVLGSNVCVNVVVLDVNDNAPEFDAPVYELHVAEDVRQDVVVAVVKATDKDDGENARVQYSFVSSSNGSFGMDRDTGEISVRTKLNYETKSFHRLVVVATDCSVDGPRLSAIAEVRVTLTDVNEHKPSFSALIYLESVPENQPSGTSVFSAHATDKDGGEFGTVAYRLVPSGREDEGILRINSTTGLVTTSSVLAYTLENGGISRKYNFKVVAEDVGGLNATIILQLSVEPEEMKPRFTRPSYSIVVAGNARAGESVGSVEAVDKDGNRSVHIIYFFETENEFFAINRTNGIIVLLKSLSSTSLVGGGGGGQRRSAATSRSKREQEEESMQLVVIAQCGFPDAKKSTVVVSVAVDRLCVSCSLIVAAATAPLTGTHLILLIIFLVVAVVMVTVIAGILLRSRRRKNCRDESSSTTSRSESSSVDTIDVGPPPPIGNLLLPPYMEVQTFLLQNTTSEMTNRSGSMSSGRGSVNKGEDIDEEIQLINSEALGLARFNEPDSGLLMDDVGVRVVASPPSNDVNSRMSTAKTKREKRPIGGRVVDLGADTTSVESMHHFSDEGGGEGDGLDIREVTRDDLNINDGKFADDVELAFPYNVKRCLGNPKSGQKPDQVNPKHPGSDSSVAGREDELGRTGLDWNYLVNWEPDYLRFADVFNEMALLKDENRKPKIRPTQFVVQPSGLVSRFLAFGHDRLFPPPIITDAPPRSMPLLAHSSGRTSNVSNLTNSNTVSSGQTSQLNSVSLPKSAFSYESAFTTSPTLSPPFTPSMSPFGTCSPAVSAWNAQTGTDTPERLMSDLDLDPDQSSVAKYNNGSRKYALVRTSSDSDLDLEVET